MVVLVTGGLGFIGSHLVKELLDKGHQVITIDNLSTGNPQNGDNRAINISGSCEEIYEMEQLFERYRPEVVYHLAGQVSVPFSMEEPYIDMEWNYKSMMILVELGKKYGVHKIIFSSTSAVYGEQEELPIKETAETRPQSPYALHKLMAENYLKMSGIPHVIFRFSNVYGERQETGVIPSFILGAYEMNKITIYGDGEQSRDFIYVGDLVNALTIAMDKGEGIINLSTGKKTTINDLSNMLCTLCSSTNNYVEIMYKDTRKGDIYTSVLCNKRAIDLLGWKPLTPLYEGLYSTVNNYTQFSCKYDNGVV